MREIYTLILFTLYSATLSAQNSPSRLPAYNPENTGTNNAQVSLSWLNDVARIRVGGNGPGAGNGLDIQSFGDISLLRLPHDSDALFKNSINTEGDVTLYGAIRFSNFNENVLKLYSSEDGLLEWHTALWPLGTPGFAISDAGDKRILLNIRGNSYLMGGNVGIGTKTPGSKLTVAGEIYAREVKVDINAGADFVFKENYQISSLPALEAYITAHNHLPGIPAESEMKEHGLELGEFQVKLLQKIEELTLYVIEQNKEIAALKKKVEQLESK